MEKSFTIAERVKRGMAFMDKKLGPLWFKKIDLVRLDLNKPASCPLGQTDSDYYEHAGKLGLDPDGQRAVDLGFNVKGGLNDRGNEMLRLTRAWRLAIARRLNKNQSRLF